MPQQGRHNPQVGTIGDRRRCLPPRVDQWSECWV
jgi:hypothetical protein